MIKLLVFSILPFVCILAGVVYLTGDQTFGEERKLTLTGRLWSLREEVSHTDDHKFFLDPDSDGETIEINTLSPGLNQQWLLGTEGQRVEVTIHVIPNGTAPQGH